MSEELRLIVLHMNDDAPKKCTARKLARFDKVRLVDKISMIPRGALLLDPCAKQCLSPADLKVVSQCGLVGLDCSWEHIDEMFARLRKRCVPRALPFVVAANPVNYGKPFQLTTAEALAVSCWILKQKEQSKSLMMLFKWGPHFLDLNKLPLDEYAEAKNSAQILEIMKEYMVD